MYREEKNNDIFKRKIPKSAVYSGFFIFAVLFICLATYFSTKDVLDIIVSSIKYHEAEGVDYKVYYQENPFYTEPYISEGKTYIAKYIDTVDADFSYLVDYSDKISGSYNYYIKAELIAYVPGNKKDELWKKEYQLTEVDTVDFINNSTYQVNQNVKIDYQMYRNDYENYLNNTAISSDAILIVELIVNNHGTYPDLDNFAYQSVVKLEIPISESTFKINTSSTIKNEEKKISKSEDATFEKTLIMVIAGLLWILVIVTIVGLISYHSISQKKLSYYEKKLKKILVTYDPIIVNVENLPSLSSLNVVDVTTFEELVDAQNEVRLPINFKEDPKKKVAKFILVNDNLAWVYTLKEGDFEEQKK